jgi:hypothetical protein
MILMLDVPNPEFFAALSGFEPELT